MSEPEISLKFKMSVAMKRTGEKIFASMVSIVLMIFLSFSATNASDLSKNDSEKIIQDHISEFYTALPIQFEADPFGNFENIRKAEKYGVIKTVLKSGAGIGDKNRSFNEALIGDVFTIEITTKGQSIPNFTTPGKSIFFQIMTRKVDEIVKIESDEKDTFTVYFSYTGIPNELGKFIQFDKDSYKYKGKAIIKYDIFTKQYLFDNLFWSPWDRLEWEKTSWISIEDGKKVVKYTR